MPGAAVIVTVTYVFASSSGAESLCASSSELISGFLFVVLESRAFKLYLIDSPC